jgi:hypothetical protein
LKFEVWTKLLVEGGGAWSLAGTAGNMGLVSLSNNVDEDNDEMNDDWLHY